MRVLLVGGGRWAGFIFDESQKVGAINITAVATNNKSFGGPKAPIPIYNSIDQAFKQQNFDALICACSPKKQEQIIFNPEFASIPAILEKPLIMPLPSEKTHSLRNRLLSIRNRPYLVNHFHLFHQGYLDYRNSLKQLEINELRITEGGNGPIRDFPTLFDWGPHAAGIAIDLLGSDWEINAVEREEKPKDILYRYKVRMKFRNSLGRNTSAALHFGNGFAEKERTICAIQSSEKQKKFKLPDTPRIIEGAGLSPRTLESPMNRILSVFKESFYDAPNHWPGHSLDVAIQSILILHEARNIYGGSNKSNP